MSAGTIATILKYIPWDQVVKNAPQVLEAAGKLWNSVANRNGKAAQPIPATLLPKMSETELLKAELNALKLSVGTLHEQMESSADVIKKLAAQNALLIERVELSRRRLLTLAVATGAAVLLLLGLFAMQLVRS